MFCVKVWCLAFQGAVVSSKVLRAQVILVHWGTLHYSFQIAEGLLYRKGWGLVCLTARDRKLKECRRFFFSAKHFLTGEAVCGWVDPAGGNELPSLLVFKHGGDSPRHWYLKGDGWVGTWGAFSSWACLGHASLAHGPWSYALCPHCKNKCQIAHQQEITSAQLLKLFWWMILCDFLKLMLLAPLPNHLFWSLGKGVSVPWLEHKRGLCDVGK